jgi:hypothetical protein
MRRCTIGRMTNTQALTGNLLGTTLAALLLTACTPSKPSVQAAGDAPNGRDVSCTEPLPPFTLGSKSHATKSQAAALCSCVWARLDDSGKKISEQVVHHKMDEIADSDAAAYPAQFAGAIRGCGADKL